jgi:glycosyltransferase
MKVSVITISLNSAKTITDCISSVDTQTYRNIEQIIIDGGSTDGTVEIVQNSKGSISSFLSEPDKGIYDALNKGLELATGEIIGILHSDDYFASDDTISRIVEKFSEEGNKKTDGVYGDLVYVHTDHNEKICRYWKSSRFKYEELKKGWMPPHNTLFLRKEVYKKHGNFDTSYKIASDIDLMLKVFSDKTLHFEYLPEVITKMRVGGISNNPANFLLKNKEYLEVIKRNNVGGYSTLFRKLLSKVSQYLVRRQ